MGDEGILLARMRAGVQAAVGRVGGTRKLSGVSLAALMCAAALAPVVAAAAAAGPVTLAAIGVAGVVGSEAMADIAKKAVERLRREEAQVTEASVEAELAARLEEALADQTEAASALREAAAQVLRLSDAAGALLDALRADHRLLQHVVDGLDAIHTQFGEFAFVLGDLRETVWQVKGSLLEHQAALQAGQERARQDGLLFLRVAEALDRLEARAASAGRPAGDGGPAWSGCPYLGLMPFEERDAQVFYGRGELVTQLVQRLAERLDGQGLLLVAGVSGAGKSSLLRAGLMPQLAASALGPGSGSWPRRVIRPGPSPLRELAQHLADVGGLDPVSVFRSLMETPSEAPLLVAAAVRAATRQLAETGPRTAGSAAARLVLIVDQLEELFTRVPDTEAGRAERKAFIAVLDALAAVPRTHGGPPPALLVAAVRADFLGQLIDYPVLQKALDAGPFTVGPMSEAELRTAITGPAAEAGLAVDPALVDAVVADLREGAGPGGGALPLTSQAMAAAWEYREGIELTLRAYRRAGGVADAVSRSANAVYEGLTKEQQEAARFVFDQLTVVTPNGQSRRRRCSRAELRPADARAAADTEAVLAAFSDQRLLVLGDETVEISHDVLLQAWKQLRDWLADDHLDVARRSQLIADAKEWEQKNRNPDYLYPAGQLAEIDDAVARWTGARFPSLPDIGKEFLQAAHAAADRRARLRRGGIAVLVTLTVVAVSAAGFAQNERNHAVAESNQAINNQIVAEYVGLQGTDQSLAAQLNLEARDREPTEDITSGLLNTSTIALADPLTGPGGSVGSVAFSPDGRTLAAGSDDGKVWLWNTTNPAHPILLGQPLAGPGASILSVAFSPDGHTLAAGGDDDKVWLWNTTNPAHPTLLGQPLAGPGNYVVSVAFSPDGDTLAAGSDDDKVWLWNTTNPAQPTPLGQPLTGPGGAVRSVTFSPDGRTLAAGSADDEIWLWNTTNPANPIPLGQPLSGPGGPVWSVAFSPDGRVLTAASDDDKVWLWNITNPANPIPLGQPLTGPGTPVLSVTFSPDGRTLAAASDDDKVWYWNLPPLIFAGRVGPVASVAFSPDGRTLAAASGDNEAWLWNTTSPAHPTPLSHPLSGPRIPVSSVAFSPDGRTLATGGSDDEVALWNTTDPAHPTPLGQPLTGPGGPVVSVAFSPDGRTLAAASWDHKVWLWDTTDPAHPTPLGQPLTGPSAAIYSVAFSPDGRTLAAGGSDHEVWLWNMTDPAHPTPLGQPLTGPGAAIYSVAFSPDGRTLAAASWDRKVWLWDTASPAHPTPLGQPLTGPGGPVVSVAFSPDGRTLAAASWDRKVWLWDTTDPAHPTPLGQPLTGPDAAIYSVAFSPDGRTLAAGSADRMVWSWDLDIAQVTARICTTASGILTPVQWSQYISQLPYGPPCGRT